MPEHSFFLFFRLLRIGLGIEEANGSDSIGSRSLGGDVAWEDIYKLGVRQGVAAIQFNGLQQIVDAHFDLPFQLPERKLKLKWFAHAMQVENHCKSQLETASELAEIYAKNGIRTVVLKGIAAGLNYPQPNHRPCGDLDCFLMGEYERGNLIAEEHGAKVERDYYKHSHISYEGLMVENHQFCTGIRGSKRAKAFERLLQSLLENDGTAKIGDTYLECPSPMFNALFLTHHAQRHFLSEGIVLRHLCDWAMLVHRQGDKMDWMSFQSYCEVYGLRRFADTMTRLADKLLHVRVPASYKIDKNDEWDDYLLHEMLYGTNSTAIGSGWKRRINVIKDISNHRMRHKMFSDTSFFRNILRLTCGFCFDRNPRL